METKEAFANRYSCREFAPEPVPEEVLRDVVATALNAPSWEDTQPWDVWVAGPEKTVELYAALSDPRAQGASRGMDVDAPHGWTPEINQRRRALYPPMLKLMEGGSRRFSQLNGEFFHAPQVVYLCMDASLGPWSLYDVGAFSMGLMLAAADAGLATIPAAAYIWYPDVVRKVLGIPESERVVIGIGIGYAADVRTNEFRAPKKGLDEVVFTD